MSTYILAFHADSDDVTIRMLQAETWQEALRVAFDTNFPILSTFSLTQEEAKENGYFINLKELLIDGLRSIQ